jgi:hypothetical protein
VRCEKIKRTSDGGNSGNENLKRGYSGVYGRVWRCLRLAGVGCLESGGRLCVGAFGMTMDSFAAKMFSHLIYFQKIF